MTKGGPPYLPYPDDEDNGPFKRKRVYGTHIQGPLRRRAKRI